MGHLSLFSRCASWYDGGWDRSIWLLVALVALPVSIVSGPVLGAFGARMWDQTHNHRTSWYNETRNTPQIRSV